MRKQYEKFSTDVTNIKTNIKAARIAAGLPMLVFAKRVGLSRKQLEDLETTRNYGSFIGIDVLCRCSDALDVTLDGMVI